jgi:hypothetical protein
MCVCAGGRERKDKQSIETDSSGMAAPGLALCRAVGASAVGGPGGKEMKTGDGREERGMEMMEMKMELEMELEMEMDTGRGIGDDRHATAGITKLYIGLRRRDV